MPPRGLPTLVVLPTAAAITTLGIAWAVRILVSLAPSRGGVLQLRGNLVRGSNPRGGILVLLAPSRGGVLLLGETRSAELTLGDPCYGPATAHPPGLGLSSP